MDQRAYIAQLNIEHYRSKLGAEQDAAKRKMLIRLLAEEEAKLAALNDPPAAMKGQQNALVRSSKDIAGGRARGGYTTAWK